MERLYCSDFARTLAVHQTIIAVNSEAKQLYVSVSVTVALRSSVLNSLLSLGAFDGEAPARRFLTIRHCGYQRGRWAATLSC